MSGSLVLVRHGQSIWNLENRFTGLRDVDLTETGRSEALASGKKLQGYHLRFDNVFASMLKRAQATCHLILESLDQKNLTPIFHPALNERDYGELSGLNKDEARTRWGDDQVHSWRRSYSTYPPGGESLRDVGARVLPYYLHDIQPHILREKNVLIVAHGNSLRALIMALEGLSPEEITEVELLTGVPLLYALNPDSTIFSKTILS